MFLVLIFRLFLLFFFSSSLAWLLVAGNEFDTTTACNKFMATAYHLPHESEKWAPMPGSVTCEKIFRGTEMISYVEPMKSCFYCLTSMTNNLVWQLVMQPYITKSNSESLYLRDKMSEA